MDRSLLHAALLAALGLQALAVASPTPQFVTRIATDEKGVQSVNLNYFSGRDALSSDGRWLVYSSGPAWRKDLVTGEVELVSENWLGNGPAGAENASVSDDGRWVCFETSLGSNIPNDTNGSYDVFLRDMEQGLTIRVNHDQFGGQTWGDCLNSTISGDGSTVVYESFDPNIVPGDFNNWRDCFAYDVATGATELITVDPSGLPGQYEDANCIIVPVSPCNWASGCAVSDDGRFVAFASRLKNLVPGGTFPWNVNVFVRDRVLQSTQLVSVNSAGQQGDSFSWLPAISADGRFVAFHSWCSNLVPGASGFGHVYLRDRMTATVHWIDQSAIAAVDGRGWRRVSISGDGMWVGYNSSADDLVLGDTNGTPDAFATHWQSGVTRRLSVSTTGQSGSPFGSCPVALSWDGSRSVFWAVADALVAGPTTLGNAVFLRDEGVQSVPVLDYCTLSTNSLGCQPAMSTSGICSLASGTPFFLTSQFERSHQPAMMAWSTSPASAPFMGSTLCVQPPMRRTPVQSTGGDSAADDCSGTCSYLFTTQYARANGLSAGDTVYAQFWVRDPLATALRNLNSSNAIAFTWAP